MLQILNMALISAVLPRMLLVWLHCPHQGVRIYFREFHITFPTTVAITPQVKHAIWGWPQRPSMSALHVGQAPYIFFVDLITRDIIKLKFLSIWWKKNGLFLLALPHCKVDSIFTWLLASLHPFLWIAYTHSLALLDWVVLLFLIN